MTKKNPTHAEKIIASKDAHKPLPHSEKLKSPTHQRDVCPTCLVRAGVVEGDSNAVIREKVYGGTGREPAPENTSEIGDDEVFGDATEAFNCISTVQDWDRALRAATDASPFFKVLTLYNIVGACMGRRWYVQLGRPLYAPHYTLLVGPSAISRKSSVKDYGRDLLNAVTGNKLRNMEASGSGEGLIEALATAGTSISNLDEIKTVKQAMAIGDFAALQELNFDQRRLQVFQDEMSAVLKKGRAESSTLHQTYMSGHGCPETLSVTTRSKNAVHVYHPILSILACSTPDRIRHDAEIITWTDGLFNRFAVGYAGPRPAKDGGSLALSKVPDPERWARVVKVLRAIYLESIEGTVLSEQVYLDPQASAMWQEMSAKHEREQRQRNEIQRGATARVSGHILRYALILAVLDHYAPQLDALGNKVKYASPSERILIESTGGVVPAGDRKAIPFMVTSEKSGRTHDLRDERNRKYWPVWEPDNWKVLGKVPIEITTLHLELAYECVLSVQASTLRLVGTLTAGNRNTVQDLIIAALTRRPNMSTSQLSALLKRHVNGVVELKRDYLIPMFDAEMIEGDDGGWRVYDKGV